MSGERSQQTAASGMLERLTRRIDLAPAWVAFALVVVPLLGIYGVSAETRQQNIDAIAAALPAWRIANHGDANMDQFDDLPLRWLVEGEDSLVSNRPPGVVWFGVPFYLVDDSVPDSSDPLPSLVPSAVAGVVSAALAMGILHLALRRVVSPTTAVGAALVGGLATPTWSVSGDQLWPHGPMQLWLSLALLASASERFGTAGISAGLAILTRPIGAVAAAGVGIFNAIFKRSIKPLLLVGAGSTAGLAVLMAYNERVFGSFSPLTDAYGTEFVEQASDRGVGWHLGNVLGALVDVDHGMLVWSSFLVLLVPGLVAAWRASPSWTRAAALSSVLYMAVHLWLNRHWGGLLWGYRYQLEMLTLAAPMLALAYRDWLARRSPTVQILFWSAVTFSVALQATVAWRHTESLFLTAS